MRLRMHTWQTRTRGEEKDAQATSRQCQMHKNATQQINIIIIIEFMERIALQSNTRNMRLIFHQYILCCARASATITVNVECERKQKKNTNRILMRVKRHLCVCAYLFF